MKIKNKLFIIMILFIVLLAISTKVQAASASVSASSTNVKPGTKVTITTKINGASWQVKLSGAVNEIYSDSTSDAENTTKYEKTTFTPSKEGTYKITLSGNVTGSADTKSTQVSDSVTIVAKNNDSNSNNNTSSSNSNSNNNNNNSSNSSKPSSNANLKNLGIKPHDFSGFKSSITTYSATVPNDTEKITIYATASDSKAKITGTGSKTLKEGKNTFSVKVTAEDKKTTKTYTLNITRNSKEDDMSSDATLKELEIRPKEYDFSGFKPNKLDYSVTVDNELDKISIYANATNSKSTITGNGEKELKVGENKFQIIVKAEDNKTTKTYNLTITRKEEEETSEDKDINGIKNIKVGNYQLSPAFSPEVYEYKLQIKENIDSVDVKVETDDENLETEIIGNNNLKKGDNIINILVTDKKQKTTTTYQIIAKVGNDEIDLTEFNNEVKSVQSNIKKTEYIIKGTIALIIILVIVFLIQKYRLGKQEEDYETDSYNIEEPEQIEEKEEKKRERHKGKRFK